VGNFFLRKNLDFKKFSLVELGRKKKKVLNAIVEFPFENYGTNIIFTIIEL
jgi:hypothetical protein